VFADVDPYSWSLDPGTALGVADQIDAAMPVAIFGTPCDPYAWDDFTAKTGKPVIIDAAAAFGNQCIGATTSAVFSLHSTKVLPAGEGGFVASTDANLLDRIRTGSNFGFDNSLVHTPGTNGKLSEYHAAIALASLDQWEETRSQRVGLACHFDSALAELRHRIDPQNAQSTARHVRSVYIVRINSGVDDRLIDGLALRGIESRRWYHPPLHEHPAFANCDRIGQLPVTRRLSKQLLGLPFHLSLPEDAPSRVAAALGELLP